MKRQERQRKVNESQTTWKNRKAIICFNELPTLMLVTTSGPTL